MVYKDNPISPQNTTELTVYWLFFILQHQAYDPEIGLKKNPNNKNHSKSRSHGKVTATVTQYAENRYQMFVSFQVKIPWQEASASQVQKQIIFQIFHSINLG